jgi:uncharacterized protein YbjT (DUF2867 family)
MNGVAGLSMDGQIVKLSPAWVQPIAADDVAEALAQVAVRAPMNGMIEVAGPEEFHLSDLVGRVLAANLDERIVVADPHARYFGVELGERTLVPDGAPHVGQTTLEAWLSRAAAR